MGTRGAVVILAGFARRSRRRAWRAASTAAGSGDPTVHAEDPTGEDAEEAAKATESEQREKERLVREGGERETPQARRTPFASSLKLDSSELAAPPESSSLQQKRRLHGLEEVTCVGFDGSPAGGAASEEQAEKDYKEYLEHHKPSPLSELELADTRTPMRRTTDSDVVDDEARAREAQAAWRKEKGDGVEAALHEAEVLFRRAAERGDPDTPYGRVLANHHRTTV